MLILILAIIVSREGDRATVLDAVGECDAACRSNACIPGGSQYGSP